MLLSRCHLSGAPMEGITRLVDDSMARHGFDPGVDHRRLEWSRWFRCDSSFSLLLVPSAGGIYTLAEEVLAPGETLGGKRILAVFQILETEDLCVDLSRLLSPRSPLSERLSAGRCFVRFARIADRQVRNAVHQSLVRWLNSSAETATGILQDSVSFTATPAQAGQPAGEDRVALRAEPRPLPGGF
jgi:hypothetical protein